MLHNIYFFSGSVVANTEISETKNREQSGCEIWHGSDVLQFSRGENLKNLADNLLPHVKSEAVRGLSLATNIAKLGASGVPDSIKHQNTSVRDKC
jgi:hypothetical protein